MCRPCLCKVKKLWRRKDVSFVAGFYFPHFLKRNPPNHETRKRATRLDSSAKSQSKLHRCARMKHTHQRSEYHPNLNESTIIYNMDQLLTIQYLSSMHHPRDKSIQFTRGGTPKKGAKENHACAILMRPLCALTSFSICGISPFPSRCDWLAFGSSSLK